MRSDGLRIGAELTRHFKELTPYFVASVLLLLAGAACGVATSTYAPGLSAGRTEALREFTRLFLGLPKPYLALAIFLNNTVKTLAVVVLGAFGGILPLIFLLVNGYVLGIVLHASIRSGALSAFFLAIAPHGLIELPAILLGTSIGLKLGVHGIKRAWGKEERPLRPEVMHGLRFFFVVIVPLLFLAALIEAFITSGIASR
ncbi:MAG: stage II sporulation protein M [Candidatus Binatia bacterium]